LARKAAFGAKLAPADGPGAAGIKISEVIPEGTAAALKLQVDDVITSVNGEKIASLPGFVGIVRTKFGGDPIDLVLTRGGKEIKVSGKLVERPRMKADGFVVNYDQVVSKGKRIRIVATHPEGKGPFPTIMLIGGIGAYSIDGDYSTTPYGTILGPLAKEGYTIIRVDKPGQGDSEGPAYTELLFDDELDAYRQALRLAKTLPYVDQNRIALFGHSMGGAFAPLVASENPVKAIVASATLAKTWFEYNLENSRRQSLLGGASAADVDDELRVMSSVFHYLFNEGKSPAEIKKLRPELATMVDAMIPDGKTYSGVGLPFFAQLAQKNLVRAWTKTDANVLTLWGESDFVSGESDHEFIRDIVNAVKPGKATFVKLAQSDHGFMKTTSFQDSMAKWGQPGGQFNDNVLTTMRTWLKANL
jgi:pimeloyl-ACP methyl ester carboxylesterase